MSIACLVVPGFALASELAEQPALADAPVVLADASGQRVAAATPAAERRGVRAGMLLREAIGLAPALAVLESHPARHDRAAAACVAGLAAVSPCVEEAAPGLVYADLRGLGRLYPTVDALERAIRTEASLAGAAAGLRPRLGVAGQKFTALVAAQAARPGGCQTVAAGDAAAFLAPRPCALLPVAPEMLERLERLGLRTLGALGALPRSAVEAQFGPLGGWAWAAARGADPEPVRGRHEVERVAERTDAEPPLVSQDAVQYTMQQLLGRALRQPAVQGRFVRALRLEIVAEDDRLWSHDQTLREPCSEREPLWFVIRSLLERERYPGPVVRLSLELRDLTRESGTQTVLFPGRVRHRERLDEMVRQLKTRFGAPPLKRVVEVEPWSRIPERRYALMDYDP